MLHHALIFIHHFLHDNSQRQEKYELGTAFISKYQQRLTIVCSQVSLFSRAINIFSIESQLLHTIKDFVPDYCAAIFNTELS